MLLAILLLSLQSAAATPPAVPRDTTPAFAPDGQKCINAKSHQAVVYRNGSSGRKLGELPLGDLHLTVIRNIGRCHVATVVKYGIGRVGESPAR
jgi:hypothetical protein